MPALTVAQDRGMAVPPGQIVRTGYVDIWQIKLACRDRMAVGDVDAAYRRRLQLGDRQPWPPPYGYWQDDRFVIVDGRHEFIACMMLGLSHVLVAWLADA